MRRTRIEDYLCTIQQICEEGDRERATTGHVARSLGVSKGTASSSLKHFAEKGLIDHLPYVGVSLTEAGRALTGRATRRYRLLQLFLSNSLDIAWDAAAEEARRLEAAASDELIERIDKSLSHPCFDPSGAPIPRSDGTMPCGRQRGSKAAPPSSRE